MKKQQFAVRYEKKLLVVVFSFPKSLHPDELLALTFRESLNVLFALLCSFQILCALFYVL